MKKIDTFDVLLSIKSKVKNNIKRKLVVDDTTRYGIGGAYSGHHPYLPLSFLYICRGYYLQITIEHEFIVGINSANEVIEKTLQAVTDFFNISRDDIILYETATVSRLKVRRKRNLKNVIKKYSKNKLKLKDCYSSRIFRNKLILTRRWKSLKNNTYNQKKKRIYLGTARKTLDKIEIDRIEYKNDYRLTVDDEALAVIDIFRISSEKSKKLIKVESKYSNRTNCSYESNNNDYVTITSYFKEYERKEKGYEEGTKIYQNILRTEVKVKNKHLNYQKKYRPKTLRNYFTFEMAEKYFKEYVEPIYFKEKFYRLDVAILEIYKKDTLKDFEKDRLSAFLTRINETGITEVKNNYDEKTFKDYTRKIRKLGINPLCFSSVIDNKPISIEKMENFTLFENAIDDDI